MEIEILNRKIGDGHPVFFVAEAGVNHNGSLDMARQLVNVAVDAGADAVKFQTFKTENIITRDAPKSTYHIQTTGGDKDQTWFELLKTQELNRDMHIALIRHCRDRNIIFLSTAYDEDSVDLLYELDVAAFKIASTDTNNIPFLRYIARKERSVILSTAMSNMDEVEQAVGIFREEGIDDIVVVQCTGNYPAKLEESNLRVMQTYREKLKCLVGYSDHTPDFINPIAATAMGACVYEKHFTIDKTLPGPDHRMSLDPQELAITVRYIRETEVALGSSQKIVLEGEKGNQCKLRKSLVAATDILKGTILRSDMITSKRPGTGIQPSRIDDIIGRLSIVDIEKDSILEKEMFSE